MHGQGLHLRDVPVNSLFVVAKFTFRPKCIKCDGERFRWRYKTNVEQEGMEILSGPEYPNLRMTCERCGYAFNMETKDADK